MRDEFSNNNNNRHSWIANLVSAAVAGIISIVGTTTKLTSDIQIVSEKLNVVQRDIDRRNAAIDQLDARIMLVEKQIEKTVYRGRIR